MAKKTPDVPPKKLEQYEALVAKFPDIPRKGAANPYTSLNGHMFSFLLKNGRLAVRLGKDELEAFMKKHRAKQPVVWDTVMKEYVEVPDKILANTKEAAKLFQKSIDYVASLKPKATKKKATKKKAKKATKKKATKKKATKKKAAGKATKKKTVTKKKAAKKLTRKKTVTKKKTTRKVSTRR